MHFPFAACTARRALAVGTVVSLSLSDKVGGDNEACYSLIGRRYARTATT